MGDASSNMDLAPPSADELSGSAPAPASVVDNFNAATTGGTSDLAPPSADDIAGTSPTQGYTYGGPITVAPPKPGSDDQIHNMIKNLSKSNLVNDDERGVLEGYIKSKAAIPEAVATTLTGAVAKPVSEIAGLAAKAYDAVTGNQNGDPEGFKNQIQQDFTYSPRTEGGREIVRGLGELGEATLGKISDFDAKHNAELAKMVGAPDDLVDRIYSGSKEASQQLLSFFGVKGGAKAAAAPELKYPTITPGDLALGYDKAGQDSIDRLLDRQHAPLPAAEPTPAPEPTAAPGAVSAPSAAPAKQSGRVGKQTEPDADFTEAESQPKPVGSPDHPMRSGAPYVMISGELSPDKTGLPAEENADANNVRHQQLGQVLKAGGFNAAPTIGAYNGTPEKSYAVQTPDDKTLQAVQNIGKNFGQESVLHVDGDKNATLKYSDPKVPDEDMGKMTPVSPEEAQKAVGWTRDADGNHYTTKKPKPAAEETVPPEPENPEAGFKSLYGPPHKFGSTEAEPTPEGQAKRIATYNRIGGIDEVPNSGVTGSYDDAGTEHQTALLKNPVGQRIAGVIDANRQALTKHAESLVNMTGGTPGLEGAEYNRGTKLEAPIHGLQDHLDASMDDAYKQAMAAGKGKLVPMTKLQNVLENNKSQFSMMEGGLGKRASIYDRAKELGILGPKTEQFPNGQILPATVEQADAMRKFIGDAYEPKFYKVLGNLKNAIDDDVGAVVGPETFARPREIRTLISHVLEQPKGVSKLLQSSKGNALGLNRQVPQEKVPEFIRTLPLDQFKHYTDVLEQAAQSGVPKLRKQARDALGEVRAQFANKYFEAVNRRKGDFDQPAGNAFLKENELKMRHVFEPSEMQAFIDNDNAGRWLSKDARYPGAEAQKQNMRGKAAEFAGKALSHGVGGVVGTGAGYVAGHTIGGMMGSAAGQVAGMAAENLGNKIAAKQAESMLTKIAAAEPAKPKGANIPGQRGAVGNVGKQSTAGMRSKQTSGAVKPKTQDLMDDAIPPRDTRGWGPHEKIIDELLEGFGRPPGEKGNPTREAAIRGEAKALSNEKSERGEIIRDLLKADPNKEESYEHVDRALDYLNDYEDRMKKPQLPARESGSQSVRIEPLTQNRLNSIGGERPRNPSRTTVLKNPSEAEAKRWAGDDVDSVRHMIDDKGDHYMWDANDAIHDQIRDALGVSTKGRNSLAASDVIVSPTRAVQMAKTFRDEHSLGAKIPGQAGRVGSDVGKQSTAGMRSKQGGGALKLPKEITGGLTEPERQQLRADTTARVLDAFHGLGKNLTPELAAAALEGKAKRGWYRNSAEAITNLFGPDAPRFAGVLAAMSPQTSVEMNLHNAIRTFINWDKAGRPTDPKAIEGIMRNSVQKARPEDPGLLHAWVPNTIKALTHANPENLPIPVNPAAKPSAQVRKVADQYMKSTGREYTRPEPTQVDPERAKKIADAYEAMEHNPNDPKVKASYNAMIKETMDQYQAMKKSGLKVEFFPESGKDPYEGNPRAAIDDIQNNNHLYVYPTKDGFGSTAGPTDNPLLADSGEKFGKVPATHNDIFRAVHDYFGHAADGNGFRAAGEENAWRQHAAMYSDLARPAMTTETRGQNSWVNFGPHGDTNRTAKQGDTVYAEQKTGLLPKEFSDPKNVGKNELQLSGPKVNSFMKNLRDSVNEVTLDAWMSTFANIDPAKLGGSGNLSGPGKSPTYLAYSAHVRNAASMLTQMTGEKWTPAEVQETVWSFAKTAFEYAAEHGISVEQAMKSGAITDDLIRSTPDFHTLFSSPEHAGFIQSSRYADNAKRLGGGQSQSTNAADSGQKSQAAKEALRPHLVSATKRLDTVLEGRRSAGRVKPKTDAIDMGGKLMSSDNGEAPF